MFWERSYTNQPTFHLPASYLLSMIWPWTLIIGYSINRTFYTGVSCRYATEEECMIADRNLYQGSWYLRHYGLQGETFIILFEGIRSTADEIYHCEIQCALDISRSFSSYNSRKTPYISPERARYAWMQIWPKYYNCNCCAAWTIVSYITEKYRESIVLRKIDAVLQFAKTSP